MEQEQPLCPECERPIYGRADKKFCSDSCRNAFNNKQNADDMNYMRMVNNTLRKNRRILKKLNTSGKTKIHRDKLLTNGFDFKYHTNTYTTKAGDVYYFSYEQGVRELDDGYVLIVKRDDS
jgi:predicted nucleic acid-binding Zn ribbon protein